MAKYRCNSCGGTYSDVLQDGTAYYHACGPIHNPAFNLDSAKGPLDTRDSIERPNKRDENAPVTLRVVNGKPVLVTADVHDATRQIETPAASLIVSEGAGRTLVPDAAL